ncbi:hypothetical protein [Xanthomonas hortorum]|uniref:hypothetical protein n=2 Tax=Xanthomonas hortorum TaxID=56454 RepID=UPI0011AFFFFD|nr:hypothetical protein [Xanthomonas hortorum]
MSGILPERPSAAYHLKNFIKSSAMQVKPSLQWHRIAANAALVLAAGTVGSIVTAQHRFNPGSAEVAAWAQFAAATIGVGIAIYVPWRQRGHQIADEAKKEVALQKTMAVALYQPMRTFGARCLVLADRIDTGQLAEAPETLFDRPPEFDQFRTSLHLLGDLGRKANELVGQQADMWLLLQAISHPDNKSNPEFLLDTARKFHEVSEAAINCALELRKYE